MCGISGILSLDNKKVNALGSSVELMNRMQKHRGPDGQKSWLHNDEIIGFGHQRLSIIDLSTGDQPMTDESGNTICYNGEIYNYIELKNELKAGYSFKTSSDTEVILAAYQKWGEDCVNHLRGMFAFALWDEKKHKLFCARDRFGIKPFYYTVHKGIFYFSSEAKTLLPFMDEIRTNINALKDYLFFQLCLGESTLFEGINELSPAHRLTIEKGKITISKYWEVYYNLDFEHKYKYFEEKIISLIEDSVKVHCRSDVPVGAYLSGGVDSGIISSLAVHQRSGEEFMAFSGKFSYGDSYDESYYAQKLAEMRGMRLLEVDITHQDFIDSIRNVIYHLDYPVAGPGSFPQYHVSKLAAKHRKVVLGGQGGDEIFGGYTRYLLAYFEQCIKGAIDGTLKNGNFIVTYESIIPNLVALQNYKPLMKDFFKEGLFDAIDKRYFRLINRSSDMGNEIKWGELGGYDPFVTFQNIFNGNNVGKESYFDKMTHFDFKTLLPGLLQVEDRMSMAHGLESRVPFLDHELVEFAATIPSNIKFKDGSLKMLLVNSMKHTLPKEITERKNKMGFPVPLNEWIGKELKEFVGDIFNSAPAKTRPYFNNKDILKGLTTSKNKFGRKVWGLLSLELWHQEFHDKQGFYKKQLN